MARIAFIHGASSFDGASLRERPLGGTETVVVQLAEALAARGHHLTVLTGQPEPLDMNGVSWRPVRAGKIIDADLAVGISDATNLNHARAPRRVVWIHNARASDRFLRKCGPLATFRYWPAAVVMGAYHDSKVSRFIPYSRRVVIPHAIAEPFTTTAPAETVPPPRAIHFSQPYRDAQNLVRIWVESIHPRVREAEFHIFGGDWRPEGYSDKVLAESGIVLRDRTSKDGLVEEMRQARVMLYRGHKDETFCLAAAESIAMGVPVVTAGIGALKERVRHGETGLIGESDAEFADAAVRALTDDALWSRMHAHGVATRAENSWDSIAAEWENAFLGS
ncbi:MAG: glycosyltransferase family 4 protein [Proteobacteria bacterium]|nr:glycosyltransferase family 4 protein [Pseudomonadota bacterium]